MSMYLGSQKVDPALKIFTNINNQDITITEDGTYTADTGYTGFGTVTVDVGATEPSQGFLAQVIDYDGTILKKEILLPGKTFTLPEAPVRSGLVFDGWSSPVNIVNNAVEMTDQDVTIGAMWHTASGLTEFDITATPVTGKTIYLWMDGTKNWGDGTSDTSTQHTYADYGSYTITCDGTTITNEYGIFNDQTTGADPSTDSPVMCTQIRFSKTFNFNHLNRLKGGNIRSIILPNTMTEFPYECYLNHLRVLVIPNSVTALSEDISSSLQAVVIPNSVTDFNYYTFAGSPLTSVTIPPSVVDTIGVGSLQSNYCKYIKIPEGVTRIGDFAFRRGTLETVSLPSTLQGLAPNAFMGCAIRAITIPEGITTISDGSFSECLLLSEVTLPSTCTAIDSSAFSECYSLRHIELPYGLTTIGSHAFFDCGLEKLYFPPTVMNIGGTAFELCDDCFEYDFSDHTSIPSIESYAFGVPSDSLNPLCQIKVPASLEAQWKAATNWSVYADYIVGV